MLYLAHCICLISMYVDNSRLSVRNMSQKYLIILEGLRIRAEQPTNVELALPQLYFLLSLKELSARVHPSGLVCYLAKQNLVCLM